MQDDSFLKLFSIVALILVVVVPGFLLIKSILSQMRKWREAAQELTLQEEARLTTMAQSYGNKPVFICTSILPLTVPLEESPGNGMPVLDYLATDSPDWVGGVDFYDAYELDGLPSVEIKPGMQLVFNEKSFLIRQIHFTEDNLEGTDEMGPAGKHYPIIIQAPGIDFKLLKQQLDLDPENSNVPLMIKTDILSVEAYEKTGSSKIPPPIV